MAGRVSNCECASICQLRPVALSGARQTPGDDGVLLRWRPAAAAAAEHARRDGDAGQGHDVRRRERRSGFRVLWRQSVGAGPYTARAGPADSRAPRRLASAGEPFQGLQAARTVPCRGARERIITPSGSGRAKPARSRSCPSSSPAITRNSPCSEPRRCAGTARPSASTRPSRAFRRIPADPAGRTPRWCGFPRPTTATCMSPTSAR